jgi:hypothetical protein
MTETQKVDIFEPSCIYIYIYDISIFDVNNQLRSVIDLDNRNLNC